MAKVLLPRVEPVMLAALLYLGGAVALWGGSLLRRRVDEARLQRADVPSLVGVAILGGGLGPVLMLCGLTRLSGVSGALLLNLEAPFTMMIAVLLFREHLGPRAGLAAACIVGGGVVLAAPDAWALGDEFGALMLAGACLCWGIDNNICQRLSLRDPVAVVRVKALTAGLGNLGIAFALGERFPAAEVLGGALALGALSYGLSLLLDMHALRLLGAAREAAYFATAPFLGAAMAIPLLGEHPGLSHAAAALLMAAGVVLLRRETHSHEHTHDPLEHEHVHMHDEHHQHIHEGPVSEPHSHSHRHDPVTHTHPHVPDLHHRHRH
jgi:drug/metabolite transporter (DMT)-like permease